MSPNEQPTRSSSIERVNAPLDDNNFVAWSMFITTILRLEGLWDDTNDEPKSTPRSIATLITNLSQSVAMDIIDVQHDAAKIWDRLRKKYASRKFGNVFRLKTELFAIGQDFKDVETLASKIKLLCLKLAKVGEPVSETDKICHFFKWLPEEFNAVIGSLSALLDENSTLENVADTVINEERRLKEQNKVNEAAFKVGPSSFRERKSNKMPQYPPCEYCEKTNHSSERCFLKKSIEKINKKLKESANKAESGNKDIFDIYEWLLDSGASSHMTSNRQLFEKYKSLSSPIAVELADDSILQAFGSGDILMNLTEDRSIRLRNVLYVPGLSANLISISRIISHGHHVIIDQDGVHCKSTNGTEFATGFQRNNLYVLRDFNIRMESCRVVNQIFNQQESLKLWHHRLGHLNYSDVIRLDTQNAATGISVNKKEHITDDCNGCKLGKMNRKPFPSSTSRATRPFELIHSDICGPFQTQSIGGKKYFVTFIDDYSRYTTVFAIREKREAFEKFVEFYNSTSNLFADRNNGSGYSIKTLRSDNGGEYTSKAFEKFCKEKGILHQFTAPYSAQQNGVAERMNRTLIEMVRCMIHQNTTPLSFWGEALSTAVYIRNRVPSSAIEGKTPYELWFGNIPDISNLRIFWCDAFVHIPDAQRRKLDPKARKCKFVGYSSQQKAYRFWDPIDKKIRTSRDVEFNENSIFRPETYTSNHQKQFPAFVEIYENDQNFIPVEIPMENHENNDDAVPNEDVIIPEPIPNVEVENPIIGEDEPNENFEFDNPQQNIDEYDEIFHDAVDQNDANIEPVDLEDPIPEVMAPNPEQRYPTRNRQPPKKYWENAYYCRETLSKLPPPTSLKEAEERPDWPEWKKAIDDEYQSLLENDTWEEVTLPPGQNLVGSKFVFKVKENSDGSINRYKARLVARGFSQKFGVDFEDTFAPVVKFPSIRTILAIGAKRNMEIHQMDVKTAFLNSKLNEDVYMRPPPGFELPDGKVLKLKKALYGLKQSPREWNKTLSDFLISLGFKQSLADPCIFVKWENDELTIISVYVDDLIILADSKETLRSLKAALGNRFKMSDLGELTYCLGLEISRDRENRLLRISQEKYIRDILDRFGMTSCRPVSTPLEPNIENVQNETEQDMSRVPYRSAVGSIMYVMKGSRPDIAAAFSYVSKFLENPKWRHWMAVKRILRYLQGTLHYGLIYGLNIDDLLFEGFTDSDWAADRTDRRSISGNVFKLYGAPISWQSKKQQTVALSSTEAEYMAASLATQEAVWLRLLLEDLTIKQDSATILHEDNQGCISLSKDATNHPRTKHIDIRHHFIREKVENNVVKLEYISTDKNEADLLTKGLSRPQFEKLRQLIGISDRQLSGSIEDKQSIRSRSQATTPLA